METPNEEGVIVEFVFGDAPFREGYIQIGSFESDAPNWSRIYVTVPVEWADARPELLNDFVIRMSNGFINIFNDGGIDTSLDRFRYYEIREKEYIHKALGYFCNESSPPTFRDSYLLTKEEFETFKGARDKIAEFYKDVQWYSPVKENYSNYKKIIRGVWQKQKERGQPDYSGIDTVNINSAFNNWAASITSFLNHIEKRLKNRDSEVYWQKFHTHTSKQYDGNVSYRFLYGLRNFIQHQAPPIHINYGGELENDMPVFQIIVYCLKNELLESTKWNAKQREDIMKMDDVIEISSHIASMMESINQILTEHFTDEFLYLRQSAMYIHNLMQKIPQGEDRGVYEIKFSDKEMVGMVAYLMYTDIVKAIVDGDVYQILKAS